MNLRHVKMKKDGKEITFSINIDNPVRIVSRLKYEKNKQSYPFCNWQVLKVSSVTSKWYFSVTLFFANESLFLFRV